VFNTLSSRISLAFPPPRKSRCWLHALHLIPRRSFHGETRAAEGPRPPSFAFLFLHFNLKHSAASNNKGARLRHASLLPPPPPPLPHSYPCLFLGPFHPSPVPVYFLPLRPWQTTTLHTSLWTLTHEKRPICFQQWQPLDRIQTQKSRFQQHPPPHANA